MPRVKKTATKIEPETQTAPATEPTKRRGRRAAAATADPAPAPTAEPTKRRGRRAAAEPVSADPGTNGHHKNEWKVVDPDDNAVVTLTGTTGRGKHQEAIEDFIKSRGRKQTTVKMVKDALADSVPAAYADYVVRNAVYREFLAVQ